MPNRLTQVLGHDPTGQALGAALRHMEIAEEEIVKAQQQHPSKAGMLRNSFLACHTPIIPPLPHLDALYRTHVRQLLAMIAAGQDVDRPTLAEAYGLEPVPAPPHIGEHLWPALRQACRMVFLSAHGKARSQLLAEALRAGKARR